MAAKRCLAVACVLLATLVAGAAAAAETIRVGVLKFGTVNWELDTIKHHNLDVAEGFTLEVVPFASGQATKVALQAGEVDAIVSDWLWVSRRRTAGASLAFVPYSSSVGAVMVPAGSAVTTLADLKGRKIAIAGGPLDKSWLLLQGLARRDHGIDLKAETEQVFGAPPLLAKKAEQGEVDAVLNYWHYSARLEAKGFRRLIGAEDAAAALGAEDRVSAIGYVFDEDWAAANPTASRGLVEASRAAKRLLAQSDAEWERLRPLTKAADDATLEALKRRFREGIPARSVVEEERDAGRLYAILAKLGGEKLVGPAPEMADGTYWSVLKSGW